jgi:hypothetical protein
LGIKLPTNSPRTRIKRDSGNRVVSGVLANQFRGPPKTRFY